jgi:hypothetical protein
LTPWPFGGQFEMFAAEGWDRTTKAGTEGNAMENAALGSDRQRHAAGKRPGVNWSRWATWTAGFIAFPIAGLAGRGVIGNVDDPVAALVGGGVPGAVIGTGQWLASRREVGEPALWIGASAGGMGVGLLAGAAAVAWRGNGSEPADAGPSRRRGRAMGHVVVGTGRLTKSPGS